MKAILASVVLCFSMAASATATYKTGKFCGVVQDDGAQGTILDGSYNANVQWMEMDSSTDPKDVSTLVAQNIGKCLCVEGTIKTEGDYTSFVTITGALECNTLRRIR